MAVGVGLEEVDVIIVVKALVTVVAVADTEAGPVIVEDVEELDEPELVKSLEDELDEYRLDKLMLAGLATVELEELDAVAGSSTTEEDELRLDNPISADDGPTELLEVDDEELEESLDVEESLDEVDVGSSELEVVVTGSSTDELGEVYVESFEKVDLVSEDSVEVSELVLGLEDELVVKPEYSDVEDALSTELVLEVETPSLDVAMAGAPTVEVELSDELELSVDVDEFELMLGSEL